MSDTAFRKIDIDALDEDTLQEHELYDPDPRDPQTVTSDAKGKTAQVRNSLSKCVDSSLLHLIVISDFQAIRINNRGDIAGALNVILSQAPYGPNVTEAKVRLQIS